MTLWPALMHLRVQGKRHARFGLWIPLFLLWPLMLAIVFLALGASLIADAVLLAAGARYHHHTHLLIESLRALGACRGLSVHVTDRDTLFDLKLI